jgi:hypothetical protein
MNTINVNGINMPKVLVKLIFAKSSLGFLAAGMKMRNVSVKIIKNSLAQEGVILSSRTAVQCREEVIAWIGYIKSNQ